MSRAKYLLLVAVIELILIGLIYEITVRFGFIDDGLANTTLIEFLPDECEVYNKSRDITASIEFDCDKLGNIVDRTSIHLVTKGVHAGSNTAFRIASRNLSQIPLTVDEYHLEISDDNRYLSGAIYFSGRIKIYKSNDEYYDILGEFKNVRLSKLSDSLTSIMKYRKIDIGEKLIIELNQQIDEDSEGYEEQAGLKYRLIPVFKQYFPRQGDPNTTGE